MAFGECTERKIPLKYILLLLAFREVTFVLLLLLLSPPIFALTELLLFTMYNTTMQQPPLFSLHNFQRLSDLPHIISYLLLLRYLCYYTFRPSVKVAASSD